MDWSLAIQRNRTALAAVVAAIAALIGGAGDGLLARRVRSAALSLLRPAESALRRLIVIAARGLVVAPRARPPVAAMFGAGREQGLAGRAPAFRLFDPPLRFARLRPAPPRGIPRIRSFWGPASPPPAAPAAPRGRPDPAALVDGSRLRRRFAAFERALADLPRQARRLARRQAGLRANPLRPLRIGRPPGWRARGDRPVDDLLKECHALALEARADTS